MALPQPQQFNVTQGNGQVLSQWALVSGATKYQVDRSTDLTTWSTLTSTEPSSQYLDTTTLVGVTYWFRVKALSLTDSSSFTSPQSIVPTVSGNMTLGQVALAARQRADRVNSNFVTAPELSSYINQSYFELYDLLTTLFQEYYVAPPATFLTTSNQGTYPLPDGILSFTNDVGVSAVARPYYKLIGVDLGLNTANNAWVTVHKFNFIDRNRFVYPNSNSTIYGVFNLEYRVMGNNIQFIPPPTARQPVRLWYVPRMATLLKDADMLDGVSGWTEYVIVDAAIKILQKEESDVSVLMAQKQALLERINKSAASRDAGMPDKISDTRRGGDGSGGPMGPMGGW